MNYDEKQPRSATQEIYIKPLVIICGLGQIGFRCFELLRSAGYGVCVVTTSTTDDWMQIVIASGGRVIRGDARSDKHLVDAGILHASGIIVATDQDIVNVSIAMYARRLNASIRIVCRMFDTNLGKHIQESFGVTQVFSTSELAKHAFVEALQQQRPLPLHRKKSLQSSKRKNDVRRLLRGSEKIQNTRMRSSNESGGEPEQ